VSRATHRLDVYTTTLLARYRGLSQSFPRQKPQSL
jgi:hypothetical protein